MAIKMSRAVVGCLLLVDVLCMASGVTAQEPDLLAGPEQEAMTDTLHHALEFNRTNESSDWVNPDTGRAGGVVPVRTFEGTQGRPCREFLTTIIIGGREEQGYGTACRQPDGDWQIVADDLQTPPSAATPGPKSVRVNPLPMEYYDYPTGVYGSQRIFLSFGFVFRDGHRHSGHRYLGGAEFRHRYPLIIRESVFVGPRVFGHYPWRDRHDRRGRGGYRDEGYHRDRDRGRYHDEDDDHRGGDDSRGRGRRGRGSDDR